MLMEASPTTVDKRYVLQERLGAGGMGEVFRAYDRLTGQIIALKRVLPNANLHLIDSQADNKHLSLALAREFQFLATLRHPHIISVLDYGFAEDQQSYFTMELLDAPRNIYQVGRELTTVGKVHLLMQTLQALAYLHRRGIIHRGLKPGNILLNAAQRVKVLDFGLSVARRGIQPYGVAGTMAYMAPEVMQGDAPTQAADLYAVGVIAYELFTGQRPFMADNLAQLVQEVLNAPPDMTPIVEMRFDARKMTLADLPSLPEDDDSLGIIFHRQSIQNLFISINDLEEVSLAEIEAIALDNARPLHSPHQPTTLAAIVERRLAKTPEARFNTAEEVIGAFSRAIGQPIPMETLDIRESYLRGATFVGREAELNQLTVALQHITAPSDTSRGSAWLIGGESGVGKSRLVDELRIRALVEGASVLRGQSIMEGAAPYQLWLDVLRRLVMQTPLEDAEIRVFRLLLPDLERLLDRPLEPLAEGETGIVPERLGTALEAILRRQTAPMVLVLEDLHWAQESLAVLRQIALLTSELPLLIIGTYRVEERPALPRELPELTHLPLPRLTTDEISELSGSILGEAGQRADLVALLNRETEGNVFFILEVLRALAAETGQLADISRRELPEHVFTGGVQNAIWRRLMRVPLDAMPLLKLAAVAGREVDLAVMQAANPEIPLYRWLTMCASVLEVRENRWQFAHDKIREGVLEMLLPEERPGLHRWVAAAIEGAYKHDPARYSLLAFHWKQAEDLPKEAHYSALAGEQALANGVYEEAIRQLSRALEIGTFSARRQAALHRQLGQAYYGRGNVVEYRARLEKGLEHLGQPMPTQTLTLILGIAWQLLIQIGHWLLPRRWYRLEGEAAEDSIELARLYGQGLYGYFFNDQFWQMIYVALRSANLAEATDSPVERAEAYALMGTMWSLNRVVPFHRRIGRFYQHRTQRLTQTRQGERALVITYYAPSIQQLAYGNLLQARTTLLQAAQLAYDPKYITRHYLNLYTTLIDVYYLMGAHGQALQMVEENLVTARRLNDPQVIVATLPYRLLLYLHQERYLDIPAALNELRGVITADIGVSTQIYAGGVSALAEWRMGNHAAALHQAHETFALIAAIPISVGWFIYEGYSSVAEVFLRAWEAGLADDSIAPTIKRLVHLFGVLAYFFPIGRSRVMVWRGLYAWQMGKPKRAHRVWRRALQTARRYHAVYDEALIHYEIGRHFPPDDERHTTHLRRALTLFENADLSYEISMTRRVLPSLDEAKRRVTESQAHAIP